MDRSISRQGAKPQRIPAMTQLSPGKQCRLIYKAQTIAPRIFTVERNFAPGRVFFAALRLGVRCCGPFSATASKRSVHAKTLSRKGIAKRLEPMFEINKENS